MKTVLPEFHVGGLFRSGKLELPYSAGGDYARPYHLCPRDEAPHWIYFVQGDDGGPVKIGRSNISPFRRIEALQQGYPHGRLRLVAVIRGTGATEKAMHARFVSSRVRGEWFGLTPDLVSLINEIRDAGPAPLFGKAA